MATGENLFSMQDARNLIRYGGMRREIDWAQFDRALSYGLVEHIRAEMKSLMSYWRHKERQRVGFREAVPLLPG